MASNPTFLGSVQDVNGTKVSITLTEQTLSGLVFVNGQGYRIGQVGSFVKIPIGYLDLYGIVTQVGASAVPENIFKEQPFGLRWLSVQLIGEGERNGNFERGISQYPTIGDEVHLVSDIDLEKIYGQPENLNFVSVGHIAGAESIPALLDINKLVSRHSALLGTTGSGKSTTVAGLLSALSKPDSYPSARILLLDLHGEYSKAFGDLATVYKVVPDYPKGERHLRIPYWALSFNEFISIAFGEVGETDRSSIQEIVLDMKKNSILKGYAKGIKMESLTVDSPVSFSIHKLWYELHRKVFSTHTCTKAGQSFIEGNSTEAFAIDPNTSEPIKGDAMKVIPPKYLPQIAGSIFYSGAALNLRRQVDSLGSKLRDPRLSFLFNPMDLVPNLEGETKLDLDEPVKRWIGGEKPISILDLSGVPSELLSQLIGILLRIIYEAIFWSRNLSEGGRERPLLIILEEAHKYLNPLYSNFASLAVERIVKEGRKYGIGIMVVSQRPSEISPTILSQCGTMIALRITNQKDKGHITSSVSDGLGGLLDMLPILKTGEAIIVGESVKLPMRAQIHPPSLERRPDSIDPQVYNEKGLGGWNSPIPRADYQDVLKVWRNRNPKLTIVMERKPCESGDIISIGYDPESSTMEIEFVGARIYQFKEITSEVFNSMMDAESPSEYFESKIKPFTSNYYRV